MGNSDAQPVVVLGAGINGIAIARELLLNDVPVVLVDKADIACGATAYSSRLIHGGLRYLEYGEFRLVRESLEERTRLLRLAPHFVRPLKLYIPARGRLGGLTATLRRLLGLSVRRGKPRGAWLVRMGLWTYDRFARDPTLPTHRTDRVGAAGTPPVSRERFDTVCSYYDTQMRLPERFCQALLADCRQLAEERGLPLTVLTYHTPTLDGAELTAMPNRDDGDDAVSFRPAAVVNATGAWVDRTLATLPVASRRLMGGTKGSHLLTDSPALRRAIGGDAIYAEAEDGRPFFILPFAQMVLVGTTDLPFHGDPYEAVASEEEVAYLIESVNDVLPEVGLQRADVRMHYCGVRPLPAADEEQPGAVTRDHAIHWHEAEVPLCSIIGGKLTTCRALAEQTATRLLTRLGRPPRGNSRERAVPGSLGPGVFGIGGSGDLGTGGFEEAVPLIEPLTAEQCERLWDLFGWRLQDVVAEMVDEQGAEADFGNVVGTQLPRAIVRWVIRHEWVAALDDLVERRLMLLYDHPIRHETLKELAVLLVEEGKLTAGEERQAVERTVARLASHFGIAVVG